ncbi:MAG: hypothetical protein M1837_000081 [Sclerophora amabilis]|nr:MAG: hypothetical protein M1837_000081 [Sclerophora amabilis]
MMDRPGRPLSRHGGELLVDRSRSPALRLQKSSSQYLTTSPSPAPQKRRSWFSRSSASRPEHAGKAWVAAGANRIEYDTSALAQAQRVPELWDDHGDTLVYLFPRSANRGPSFKVDSAIYSSSTTLMHLAHGTDQSEVNDITFEVPSTPPLSPYDDDLEPKYPSQVSRNEVELYFPIALPAECTAPSSNLSRPNLSPEDLERIIYVRNLFAFLTRQPLVSTTKYPTHFAVLMTIADNLEHLHFRNLDGSTFGEVPTGSFEHFVRELKLADVRHSLEKTVEGIILGERMRCLDLYNEAFVHGVGKYDVFRDLDESFLGLISHVTRKRMERASMDLDQRLATVTVRLADFDFPSLFSGIANSTSSTESRIIPFKSWKASFLSFRKHVMGFYKDRFGSWPPKARSKKNEFEESGLNRLVLRQLYEDFSDLYDLLVDRTVFTTRSADMPPEPIDVDSLDPEETTPRALRQIMSEYDRSSPPVQPPVPFDTPRLPSILNIRSTFGSTDSKKEKKKNEKKLKHDEVDRVLAGSQNPDSHKQTPFLMSFKSFERKAAQGKTVAELREQRNGYWVFLYAVLQALPMLVVDAPGITWSDGVEYFLCEPPLGGAPWVKESSSRRKSWYGIVGGSGVVNLPSDIVDHGVEGIYRRSHCWIAAQKWGGQMGVPPPVEDDLDSPLAPPPDVLGLSARPSSPAGSTTSRHSMALGLEALPVPANVDPGRLGTPGARPVSVFDPTKRFEDIIAEIEGDNNKNKKKKKKR